MAVHEITLQQNFTGIDFQPMRDDPLQFIATISMYKLAFKHRLIFKVVFYGVFTLLQLTLVIFIMNLICTESDLSIKRYFMNFTFQQPGCIILICYPSFINYTSKFQEYYFQYYSSLNTQDEKFNKEIKKDIIIAKCVCFVLIFLSVASHVTYIVLNDKYIDEAISYTIIFYASINPFYTVVLTYAYCLMIVLAYALVYPVWATIYFVLHLKFQLNLLNRYIEVNIRGLQYFENAKESDDNYQEILSTRLRKCVEHHVNLKHVYKVQLSKLSDVPMLILCGCGLTAFVAALYFIIAEIDPKFNIVMYLILLLCVTQTSIACFYGQLITDESEELYNVLWKCPWYYWNTNNRQILLMMLINSRKPFRISCYGLWILNFEMILTAIRMSYSLSALAVKFI